ncbi:MAG: hypothetical protein M1825_001168 [Sarcosagium campestre]|nr:MAG: hypothetical protein M1825_001168 [Sarcosagium campestre]
MSLNVSLAEKLDKIRSPNLKNQQQTAVVLAAIEDTLRDQRADSSSTAYFAAILALLGQCISSSTGVVNKELAAAVVYLLDLVTPYTPEPLLRTKFTLILSHLAPALTFQDAEAPLLRSAIGCLESLLLAQDKAAWMLPQSEIGPRRAVAGLLGLAIDHRPKVRKRALEALAAVLRSPPPSPALDHPAADMCAETSLRSLSDLAKAAGKKRKHQRGDQESHEPPLIHALQLVKTVALASTGWPSRKIEPLCEVLLSISRSSQQFLVMTAFEVFEAIFKGMADEISSSKLPHLLDAMSELRPSQNDAQLLPSWMAVMSRGYDVSAQLEPQDTFYKLPDLFEQVSSGLASSSHEIRISTSECLISFLANCVPEDVVLEPSIYDEKILEKLAKQATGLLSVKYQGAWMEVFKVLGSIFATFGRRAHPLLDEAVRIIGELRGSDSFNGEKEADEVLGIAVAEIGPDAVLQILPLNLANPRPGQAGRAWMLPLLRDRIYNTKLAHFKSEFVPLSEAMYQRVLDTTRAEKTMETKIYETVVQQIWALLPGYCGLPVDLVLAFDQGFAELLANLLYRQVELRADLCRALHMLVDTNRGVLSLDDEEDHLMKKTLVNKVDAQANIDHLAKFAGNLLAVLFNVYSETLPQHRGHILECINSYLSIAPKTELMDTFNKVTVMLESSLTESKPDAQAEREKTKKNSKDKMPTMSHTFMDLVITISIHLPRDCYATLFSMAALIIAKDDDAQLQKKAYKLIPRLTKSEDGKLALRERNPELQKLLLDSAEKTTSPARRDRLTAISTVVASLPKSDLSFIPSILAEVILSAKETNEKARTAAFDVLVMMGEKMQEGGKVRQSRIPNMPTDAPDVEASMEEYFKMVSAGLTGSTPHIISATITALTRILYQFRETLPDSLLTELVSTLDLFLTTNNREVVGSCFGFVKVCVISLPTVLMIPRLESIIPNLMAWSKEHKGRFKSKVKHIIERMIRRFGFDVVEKWCPQTDRKLIVNIRKSKERSRRKKAAGAADESEDEPSGRRRPAFESEFDEAIYDSDDSAASSADSNDGASAGARRSSKREKGNRAYIVEDEDEPLDLLDRNTLSHISSSKPQRAHRPGKKSKAKTDVDGKLIFGDSKGDKLDEADPMVLDSSTAAAPPRLATDSNEIGGIDAYMAAVKGKDAVQRGQRGRLKYKNKRGADAGDEMEVDDDDGGNDKAKNAESATTGARQQRRPQGRGGSIAVRSQRKGLGVEKARGARVEKSGRGSGTKFKVSKGGRGRR